jgi:SPP1 gp7 family putative phage head morphogenesis protein
MDRSREYWAGRAEARLVESEKTARLAISQIGGIYNASLLRINSAINDLYLKISKGTGLDVSELATIMDGTERAKYVASLARSLQSMGLDINTVISPNQIRQLTRLQGLKKQIYWEVLSVADLEKKISQNTYESIINKTFNSTRVDVAGLRGVQGTFGEIDRKVAQRMISERWQGGTFKTRITKNAQDFAKVLQQELGSALITGQDLAKVQSTLRNRFGVATRDAARLIRTEAAHFRGQSTLEAYKRDGVEEYEYLAEMDSKTSEVCSDLNGQKFKLEDAVEGVNYPPLHPNCRSTTLVVVTLGEQEATTPIEAGPNNTTITGDRLNTTEVGGRQPGQLIDIYEKPINGTNKTVKLTEQEAYIAEDARLKITRPIAGDKSTQVNGEASALYRQIPGWGKQEHTIAIKASEINSKDFDRMFNHEFGHFVDRYGRQKGVMVTEAVAKLSDEAKFSIIQRRLAEYEGIQVSNMREFITTGRLVGKLNGKPYTGDLSAQLRMYLISPEELFAEIYSIRKVDPAWFRKNPHIDLTEIEEKLSKIMII